MESAEVFRRRLMESAEVFRRWLIILLVRHQSVESCIVNLKSITLHRLTLLTLSIIICTWNYIHCTFCYTCRTLADQFKLNTLHKLQKNLFSPLISNIFFYFKLIKNKYQRLESYIMCPEGTAEKSSVSHYALRCI